MVSIRPLHVILTSLYAGCLACSAIAAEIGAESQLTSKAFVSPTYTEIKRATGDLNGDGIDDVVLIVREKKADLPRQQLLVFSGTADGTYSFYRGMPFMDASEHLMEEGGISELAIKNNILTVTSDTATSMGSWAAGGCTQKWRMDASRHDLRLIGQTTSDFSRNCACGTTVDTNFLTGISVRTSDRDKNGNQLENEIHKTTKSPIQKIYWKDIQANEFCSPLPHH